MQLVETESHLHYLFDDYRIDKISEDGGSEWFDSECIDEAKEAAQRLCALKGFELSYGLPEKLLVERISASAKPVKRSKALIGKGRLIIEGFREFRDFLRGNKGVCGYYFEGNRLIIEVTGAGLNSIDAFSHCSIRAIGRGGMSFIPSAAGSNGDLCLRISIPESSCHIIDRARARMYKWLMATLKDIGALEMVSRDDSMHQETLEGLADVEAGRAVDGSDVISWVESWGSKSELPNPSISGLH